MSAKHRWNYADASGCSVGEMICTGCGKPIESGLFRYRETDHAYLPAHRACTEFDPQWAVIDRCAAESEARYLKIQPIRNAFPNCDDDDALNKIESLQSDLSSARAECEALRAAASPFNIYPNSKPEWFDDVNRYSAHKFTIADILALGQALEAK